MVHTPVKSMTLAEFLAMPETKPASEYIDGQIIQKPMPQGQHSIIQRQLLFAIDPVLSDVGIAQAFPELRCNFAGRSIDPEDRSVIVIGVGQIFDAIDEPSAILPVPEFAKSIKLTIADIFGWLQKRNKQQ
jgi:Uma2 family endonuclease